MKTMEKYIWMAAIAMTAATFTACSNDDLLEENTPAPQGKIVTLTTTLSPKGGDATTRALTDPGDGKLTSTWAVGEEIFVGYEDNGNTSPTAKARVTSVDGSGSATITVDLVDPKDDSDIYFNYPYSAISVEKDIYYDQLGTLADVSANYDMCSGSGTLHVDAGVATLPTGVTMTRDAFIWKFTFTNGTDDITSQITSLIVDDGKGCPYTVSPSGQSTIYVAMYGGMGATPYSITATTNSGVYTKTSGSVSLDNGKLYTSNGLALTAAGEVNLASQTADYTATSGDVLTGILDPAYKLIIPMDAVVMLKNATINYGGYDGPAIKCLGRATIVLADGTTNSVTVPGGNDPDQSGYPGIWAGDYGTKLTIKGSTGVLNIVGGFLAAGIGYPHYSFTSDGPGQCGVIQIDGGVINSYAGHVSVLGDGCESGIGSICSAPSGDLCEGIIINGGTVTAKGGTAGIGSSGGADVGFITINGGTVIATGGEDSPGIGAGPNAACGPITINGGTVTATGGGDAAGIGSGAGTSTYTSLTIASGITKVTATRGGNGTAEPIGHGKEDTTSPAPVFSGVTKDAVNSTESIWIYK